MDYFFRNKALTMGLVATWVIFLFIAERIFYLRIPKGNLRKRLQVNLFFLSITFIIAAFLLSPLVEISFNMVNDNDFGFLRLFDLPYIYEAVIGFLLLDLSFFFWHKLNHQILFLWRFHNIHHIDPDLDVSTTFRFHYGEVILSVCYRFFQILIISPSFSAYIVYEFCFQMATHFHHSNLKLPRRMDDFLKIIFVTPKFHENHHMTEFHYANSNYGVIFSFWDRFFKSYTSNKKKNVNIVIGVPAYKEVDDNTIKKLFTLPFKKQRDYWRKAPKGNI